MDRTLASRLLPLTQEGAVTLCLCLIRFSLINNDTSLLYTGTQFFQSDVLWMSELFQICVNKCPDRYLTYLKAYTNRILSAKDFEYYWQFCVPGFNSQQKVS